MIFQYVFIVLSVNYSTFVYHNLCLVPVSYTHLVRGQNSPVDYFNKYPGRFTMLHIKDHREIGRCV